MTILNKLKAAGLFKHEWPFVTTGNLSLGLPVSIRVKELKYFFLWTTKTLCSLFSNIYIYSNSSFFRDNMKNISSFPVFIFLLQINTDIGVFKTNSKKFACKYFVISLIIFLKKLRHKTQGFLRTSSVYQVIFKKPWRSWMK